MGFPRPAYYTIEELMECWKISVDMIEKYTERGQLHYDSLWYNSHEDEDFWLPGDKHPEGPDENDHSRTWFHKCNIYPLEEVKRFEKEHGIIPAHLPDECPPPTQSEAKTFINKRTNDFRDILIKTYNQLASSQDKEPTWQDCYDFLKNDDSRKLVDKKNYIKTVTDTGIFTTEPEENKQFISKESFKKRFQRLVNNK